MNKRREILIAGLTAFVCLVLLFLFTAKLTIDHPDFNQPWDHHKYIAMAEQPFDFHLAPFCWRVLVPLLAWMLPLNTVSSFMVLSFAGLWGTAVFLYLLLRRAGFSGALSYGGMVLFLSMGWAARYNIHDFWLVDPVALMFITACLWSLLARKNILFAFLLTAGVTAKESVIFVAPLYYTLNAERLFDRKKLLHLIIIVLPAVTVLILLRMLIVQGNGDPQYAASLDPRLLNGLDERPYVFYRLFNDIVQFRMRELVSQPALFLSSATIGTFGILPVFLFILALRKHSRCFLKFLPFVLLVFCAVFFAVNTERVMITFFPAVILFTLHAVRDFAERSGGDEKMFTITAFILFALLFVRDNWLVIPPYLDLIVTCLFITGMVLFRPLLTGKCTNNKNSEK